MHIWLIITPPLDDDVFIEWQSTTLPIKIKGTQTVFYKTQNYCVKHEFNAEIPVDAFSHYTYQDDLNQGCEDMTQEIRDIRTEVSLIQTHSELPFDFSGFDRVSVHLQDNYHWSELTAF
ncbi:hypothetical protein A9Q98_01545 [Thalassotalea sp. 42_200_T64]|nr:hypothetical protein A9Q98_01545 [Thalassotalea sp. 42_200_T64]